MTVDEWADAYRYLSPESSAEPGKFMTARAPYQREPMRALSDRNVRTVVLMFPSQVGKTEIINNFLGKRIHLDPGPILILEPTLDIAEAWSKDRLSPMLRDTPVLRGLVTEARSRISDNTMRHKKFPGGHLTIAGANSPAGLAARPIRDVLCDEIDRYPASAGSEGDPIGLASRRQATFRNGKRVLASSPTMKGSSRITLEYEDSTREKLEVPCPHCGVFQQLKWGGRDLDYGLKWESGKPETVHYVCEACHAPIEEAHKGWMNAHHQWTADNPGHVTRGFWMNALYSPWAAWCDLVREWLKIKSDPIQLRQFVNTVLCECWEDEGTTIEAHFLVERLGLGYPADASIVPAGVGILTRAVDVQGDRLETAVWGWGAGTEGWLIDHEIIPGDPGTPQPWAELDERLTVTYTHESGATIAPVVTVVDSGGHHTSEVYQFTRARVGQRVYAIKGSSLEGAPLLSKPTRNNNAKAILYMVGVFTGKESVLSRFAKIAEPGPGYLHLPSWLDGEQIAQFTNEKLMTRFVGGRPKRMWLLGGGKRNEQFDLVVYALAALHILGLKVVRNMDFYVTEMKEKGEKLKAPVSPDMPPSPEYREPVTPDVPRDTTYGSGRNWIQGWR
jgi:phage terminase large subunit GpA-like protein